MTQIKEVIRSLENFAPKAYAESYDNPGLLTGDQNEEVRGVLVSLDCIEATVDEAIAKGCNLVVSHHPIVFKGLKKLTGANYVERTLLKAIRNNIGLYATHTNLDSVMAGVNGRLSAVLGLEHTRILQPKQAALSKLTFFVPREHADRVRSALFAVGAGVIGNYADCSFNLDGMGTFTPLEGSTPFSGKTDVPETAAETRVEIMYPRHMDSTVLSTLRKAHPYEEVAYYLHHVANENQYVGLGMLGELPKALPPADFLTHLREKLNLKVIRHTAMPDHQIQKVALCGGSGSFLLHAAIAAGAHAFVSGDFKYHEFFDAEGRIMVADVGHFESEQFTIDLLAEFLREKFSTFATHLTEVYTNPVNYFL